MLLSQLCLSIYNCGCDTAKPASFAHLIGEPLDEDGDQKVEEDVVAEGHEGDEVERRPVTRVLHPGEEHDVPVLLRQDLRAEERC